jgi:hypothetical protein
MFAAALQDSNETEAIFVWTPDFGVDQEYPVDIVWRIAVPTRRVRSHPTICKEWPRSTCSMANRVMATLRPFFDCTSPPDRQKKGVACSHLPPQVPRRSRGIPYRLTPNPPPTPSSASGSAESVRGAGGSARPPRRDSSAHGCPEAVARQPLVCTRYSVVKERCFGGRRRCREMSAEVAALRCSAYKGILQLDSRRDHSESGGVPSWRVFVAGPSGVCSGSRSYA